MQKHLKCGINNFKNLGMIYQVWLILNLKECGNFIYLIVKQAFPTAQQMCLIL